MIILVYVRICKHVNTSSTITFINYGSRYMCVCVASFVCKANKMLCTFLRSIHISIFLYKVVLSFGTCSPPTLICMYALHNGTFYKQYEPKGKKKVGCTKSKIGFKGDGFLKF